MSDFEKEIQLNAECIAINQDPTEQGRKLIQDGDMEIWGKKLLDGSMALLLLNRSKTDDQTVELNPDDLGFGQNVSIKDIYSDEDFVRIKGMIRKDLGPHEGWFIIMK